MAEQSPPDWATLAPDEEVVWMGRPSLYFVKYWLTVATVVLVVGVVLFAALPLDWSWVGWPIIAGAAGVSAYAYVQQRSVVYLVTTSKVYKKTGLFGKTVETVQLDRIQNVSFDQSFFQGLVDCGDMAVDTAGSGTTEIEFECVRDPARVNGLLVDQSSR